MAVAAAAPPSPAVLAEELRSNERELRRVLPKAPVDVQALALQVLDVSRTMLDPALVAAISAPDAQKNPKALEAYAAWLRFAEIYQPILERFLAIIEKGATGSVSS